MVLWGYSNASMRVVKCSGCQHRVSKVWGHYVEVFLYLHVPFTKRFIKLRKFFCDNCFFSWLERLD